MKHFAHLRRTEGVKLGLNSLNLSQEIDQLTTRRGKLATFTFEASENYAGAKILSDMVDKYHLKDTVLSDEGGKSRFIDTASIQNELFLELSANCSTQSVIDTNKNLVVNFFNLDRKLTDNIEKVTSSSIENYDKFINYSYNYANNSFYLYFYELVNAGKLKIVPASITGPKGEDLEVMYASEQTYKDFEVLVKEQKTIFEKKYTEYLPDSIHYKPFLESSINDMFTLLVKEDEKGEDEEEFVEDVKRELSKLPEYAYKYSTVTNDLIETLTGFVRLDTASKINAIEVYKKNVSIAVLNLGIQNDSNKLILKTYGKTNLEEKERTLRSLEAENPKIDAKIQELQSEQNKISDATVELEEQKEDLQEILATVDTSFIEKNSLSEIITAQDAHKLSLRELAGRRIDGIIKEAANKGLFEVEVMVLSALEASLLIDAGYLIKESTEDKIIDPKNIGVGRKKEVLSTYTIYWDHANSVSILDEEKEP